MDWFVLPKGVLLGLSIAAPVGPIGVSTIRRTIGDGFRMGFATGPGCGDGRRDLWDGRGVWSDRDHVGADRTW